MMRDLATMVVFSSEEDCKCSCSGFYRQGMGGFEEAQGSRWSGKNQVTMADDIDYIIGASGTGNETTGGTIDKGGDGLLGGGYEAQ